MSDAAHKEPWRFATPRDWETKVQRALSAKWENGRPYNMTIFCPVCEGLMIVEVEFTPDETFAYAACLCVGEKCNVDTVVSLRGVPGE